MSNFFRAGPFGSSTGLEPVDPLHEMFSPEPPFHQISERICPTLLPSCEIVLGNQLTIAKKWRTMEFSKQLLKEVFASYLETAFSQMLPSIIQDAIKNNDLLVGQDFVSIEDAARRYNLCRKTIYNYHKKGHITLHGSEGKTFVSIREMEAYIRKNPLQRNS